MLMFHGNLVHGSAGNITPYPRKIVYLTLNAVSNYIRTPTRPEYIAHRDFTPIQTVDDDALVRLARAPPPGGGVAIGIYGRAFARSPQAKTPLPEGSGVLLSGSYAASGASVLIASEPKPRFLF